MPAHPPEQVLGPHRGLAARGEAFDNFVKSKQYTNRHFLKTKACFLKHLNDLPYAVNSSVLLTSENKTQCKRPSNAR